MHSISVVRSGDEIPGLRYVWRVLLSGLAIQVVCAALLAAMLPILVPLFLRRQVCFDDHFCLVAVAGWYVPRLAAGHWYGYLRGRQAKPS